MGGGASTPSEIGVDDVLTSTISQVNGESETPVYEQNFNEVVALLPDNPQLNNSIDATLSTSDDQTYTLFARIDNKAYYHSTSELTLSQALLHARELGGHLPYLQDEEQYNTLLNANLSGWIGPQTSGAGLNNWHPMRVGRLMTQASPSSLSRNMAIQASMQNHRRRMGTVNAARGHSTRTRRIGSSRNNKAFA